MTMTTRTDENGTAALTPMQSFQRALNSTGITERLGAVMPPRKMARFKSQLIQIVTASNGLQRCSAMSVIAAAVAAANCGLDLSPAFGQAAVIPFNNTVQVWDPKLKKKVPRKVMMAQLQIMTKGWTQLSYRSGQFSWINADAVYADEYQGSDLLSGMVYLKSVPDGFRSKGMKDRIVGFFAAFELVNGGRKVLYMPIHDIEAHARTYARSYRNYNKWPIEDDWSPDLNSTGLGWNENWFAMARKTVLKLLIQRWAPLSTEIEEAIESDQAAFSDIDSEPIYVDTEDIEEVPEEKKEILRSKSRGAEGLDALLRTDEEKPEEDAGEEAPSEPSPEPSAHQEPSGDIGTPSRPFSVPEKLRKRTSAHVDDGLDDDEEAAGDVAPDEYGELPF